MKKNLLKSKLGIKLMIAQQAKIDQLLNEVIRIAFELRSGACRERVTMVFHETVKPVETRISMNTE